MKPWKQQGKEGNHNFSCALVCRLCGVTYKNRKKPCTPEQESKVIYVNGQPITDRGQFDHLKYR